MRAVAIALLLAACGGDDDGGDPAGGADGGGGGGGAWEQLADLPGPVQETALVEIGGLLYVLGGIDREQTVADVLIHDPADDSWDRGPDLPAAVHHINAAAVDGTIYVVGSLAPDFEPMAQVWSWTPGDAEWSTDHAPMPAPARGAAVVGAVGGSIVVAGGSSDAGSSTAVAIYDPVADSWDDESSDPLPIPLDHATGQVVDGSLYVIGGRSNGIVAVSAEVFRFDDGSWTARAPMPTARGGTASGVVGGRIVVVGGEGNGDAASGVFPQAEMYDPAADDWTSLADMPTPRHGMAAAGVGNSLYVPGGADQQAFGAVATHEVLHLDE